jgi:alkyldihydroxyacetonephosphate synthase
MPPAVRRWNAWGFEGIELPVPAAACRWLAERVGEGEPLAAVAEADVAVSEARPLPPLPAAVATDPATRLRHACGRSFPDCVALRTGAIAAFPDGVAFPESAAEAAGVLRSAAAGGAAVVVRGGGSSVVGGVTIAPGERSVVVLSLDRLCGMAGLDEVSRLAAFRAGTYGPAVEAALAPAGLRLGHEPQSFELSTVGGWIAARSAGQRSTGVGKIEDLVAGIEVARADGVWRLAPLPSSAAGPELRRLVVGSEGRLGVITEATLRVRPLPAHEAGQTVLLPGWSEGLAACRELVQGGVPVEVLRLSDADESSFAASLLHLPAPLATPFRRLLRSRRFGAGCLLLLGWAGGRAEVGRARSLARRRWRAHGGLGLGGHGFASWRRERFRHPYLRDALLSAGWGVDTLETAAPWSALPLLHSRVRVAFAETAAALGVRVAVLCHLSHAYADGASLYFTFLWPLAAGAAVAQWGALKHAATTALLAAGGTVSHHHGIGTMHAPYLGCEIGEPGLGLLRAACAAADPACTLNPGILIGDDAAAHPAPGRGPHATDPDSRAAGHGPRATEGLP